MNRLWQIMPSMAFKLGLYQGAITIGKAREHGNFGVGQFAALDGELTVLDGEFFHALADGSVHLAGDEEELCFAQLCHFAPQDKWKIPGPQNQDAFATFLHSKLPFPNEFWAFRLSGYFASIVASAPPAMELPYPPFSEAIKFRKYFAAAAVEATVVGYYSPAFTSDIGVPGFHFHAITADRKLSGHVMSFEITSGTVQVERLREIVLQLPSTTEYREIVLSPSQ
jgi:acetolactate decarboxylase